MKLIAGVVLIVAVASCVHARPKYIAIPAEDIQFVNFAPAEEQRAVRVAREAVYHYPGEVEYDVEEAASEARYARQAGGGGHHHDHHDYVDYGAHTGHHGSFGWHADYPVYANEH